MDASPTAPELELSRVAPGRRVVVVRLLGDDTTCRRLADLGFWQGAEIDVVRRAPFGDPTQYRLHGYELALRRGEACCVLVDGGSPQATG